MANLSVSFDSFSTDYRSSEAAARQAGNGRRRRIVRLRMMALAVPLIFWSAAGFAAYSLIA